MVMITTDQGNSNTTETTMTKAEALQNAADLHAAFAQVQWLHGKRADDSVQSAYQYQRWASEARQRNNERAAA